MTNSTLPRRGGKIATILLASSLTVMSGAAITPATPLIKEAFPDVPQIEFLTKLMVSLPALFIAIGSPIIGQLIDLHGRLKFLYVGLVVYAIAGCSAYWVPDPYQILITRAVLGLAVACIMPVAVALIGDYFEGKEREMVTALQGAAMALGGLIFVGTAGVLADLDWRLVFVVYGFSLVVLAFAVVSLDEPVIAPSEQLRKGYFSGLTSTHTLLLGMGLVTMLIFYMIPLQVPFLLKNLGETQSTYIGLAIMANTLGSILIAANYKQFRRFLSFSGINVVLYVLMAAGFLTISLAQSYWTVVSGLALSGIGLGLFMPNFSLWILEITPAAIRGRALGLVSSAIFLGQFLSPFGVEPLLSRGWTLSHVFLLASAILLVMALVFLVLHIRVNRQNV